MELSSVEVAIRRAVILSLFLVAVQARAEPLVFTQKDKLTTIEEGVGKINGVKGIVGARAALDSDNPVKIRMKMRRTATSLENPGHFGVELLGGEEFKGHFYTHDGAHFILALHQHGAKLNDTGNKGKNVIFPAGTNAPWVDLELYVQPRLTELHVAGVPQGMVLANLLPLSRLSIYGYHNDLEFRDVEVEPLPEAEPISTDPHPSFRGAFDKGFEGTTAKGALAPLRTNKVELVAGVAGQAVRVSAQGSAKNLPALEYAAEGLFADHGTVMFWMKSDWDGKFTGDIPVYPMLTGFDAEGRDKLKINMYFWIMGALGRTGSLKPEILKRESRSSWYRGDWNHIAMVWSDGGWCKAYFNGLPYQQPFGFNGKIFANLDLKSIARFTVGTGPRAAEAAFDELKIYKRPLSNGEVYDEYRALMPVDLLVDRTVIDAGKADEVVILAAPGGFYMRPMPAERPLTAGKVSIGVKLVGEDGKTVAEKKFSLKVKAPAELKVPVDHLPAGAYRLMCTVGTVQRSFEILAYQPLEAMTPGDDGIELGEVLFAKNIKDGAILDAGGVSVVKSSIGEYLEGGDRKANRFAFEVPFPAKVLDGRPVMLEVDWPDDKPRSMGLYMYPQSKQQHHRDRLGGGIQSGLEYPLTGRMQTTRYLFHPGLSNYLFEARTMIGKFPAAIAGFRVYAIKNDRLPKLAINYPQDLPGRRFGHRDEDETTDQNMGWDYPERNTQKMTERLLDYLDYTGQNAWQYPFMRYTGYNFSMEGALHTLYPYRSDAYRYMIDALNRRGKTTIAGIDLFTLPEIMMLPDRTGEAVRKGWTLTNFDAPPVQPNQYTRPNHANPDVRAMIAAHVKETARRFAAVPGFDGINMTTHQVGFYTSLDDGYDDYTVNLFSRETGIAVSAKRGAERRAFLTEEPQRAPWLRWRAKQSAELFRLIRSELDTLSPKPTLYLNVSATPAPELAAQYEGVRAIRGISLVPLRMCTGHRHRLHWGKPSDGCNDVLFNPAETERFMNGKLGYFDSYPSYFESFNGSLKNDVYASYFQNADVKPFGRYFLKELAYAVSSMDAQRILIGAQPLGTWGRDSEAREFTKAYCALPALPFENAPGAQDPVTVRSLNTRKGSYVYAVSMLWKECECTLALSSKAPLKDLSSGELIASGRVTLKPFELRSFYSTDPDVKVTAVKTAVPRSVPEFYREGLERVQTGIARLKTGALDCVEADAALARMRELLAREQFAELHRLLFSLPVSEAMDNADNFRQISEQAAMIRRGHYAVNCGSTQFYSAKNGTLFFPDRALGKGEYGYVGTCQTVVRGTDGLQTEDPELFMSEAYGMQAYAFKVEPGSYTVRLYMKAGYKKGFKPGLFVMSVDLQGKRVLDNLDLVTACDSDFSKVLIKEFSDVVVTGQTLEIRFSNDEKHDPSVKLINAIEVLRTPARPVGP